MAPRDGTRAAGGDDLPSTLRRSKAYARRTWSAAHDAAVEQYGEGERARRTAWAALKHTHEKVGDHWEQKEGGRRGPSDEQAAEGGELAEEYREHFEVDEHGNWTAGDTDAEREAAWSEYYGEDGPPVEGAEGAEPVAVADDALAGSDSEPVAAE